MTKKNKPEIKLGTTVHLRAQSGEIITGQIVHVWEEKSVPQAKRSRPARPKSSVQILVLGTSL